MGSRRRLLGRFPASVGPFLLPQYATIGCKQRQEIICNHWLTILQPLVYAREMTVKELRDWRTAQGMSQGELATALGVSRNTVGRWELGERAIPPFLELALASIAGIGGPRPAAPPAPGNASWKDLNDMIRRTARKTARPGRKTPKRRKTK